MNAWGEEEDVGEDKYHRGDENLEELSFFEKKVTKEVRCTLNAH